MFVVNLRMTSVVKLSSEKEMYRCHLKKQHGGSSVLEVQSWKKMAEDLTHYAKTKQLNYCLKIMARIDKKYHALNGWQLRYE